MMPVRVAIVTLVGADLVGGRHSSSAWEMELTGELATRASVVRLADIAVVPTSTTSS